MRYFDDGDLTEGIAVAPKPYPFGLLLGYWHAVSTCFAGERTTVDYDDPEAPALFRLQLEAIDGRSAKGEGKGKGKGKRQREEGSQDDLMVTLNYRDWHLEYTGTYNNDGPATNLYLSNNETPEAGDVDKEATLAFGTVLDDRGYPFLRLGLSACEADSGSDDMQSIEIVAKRTDTTEVHKLELSKNERLRLGYAVRSDGQFEDLIGTGQPKDSYESLTRQLNEHTSSAARILRQLTVIRQQMDEQFREAAESGNQIHSIWQETRLSVGGSRPPPNPLTQRPPNTIPRPSSAPRPSTASGQLAAASQKKQKGPVRNERLIQTPRSAPAKVEKGKRYCKSCDKTVSLSHGAWQKHMTSRRHALMAAQGTGAGHTANVSSATSSTPQNHNSSSNQAPRSGLPTRASVNPRHQGRTSHLRNSAPTPEITDRDDEDDDNEYQVSNSASDDEGHQVNGTGSPVRQRQRVGNTRQRQQGHGRRSGTGMGAIIGDLPRSGPSATGVTQWCEVCECHISVKNWNVHTRSNKHRVNEGVAALVNGTYSAESPPAGREPDAPAEGPTDNGDSRGGYNGLGGLDGGSEEDRFRVDGDRDDDEEMVEGRPRKRARVGIARGASDELVY